MTLAEPLSLAGRRAALVASEPRLYPRDIAARLGVTEAEIVALDEGALATRLRADWTGILARIGTVGEVMALTRNGDAVHEKTGIYGTLEGGAQVGLFVGEEIDLRLFLSNWAFAWALAAPSPRGRRSLQFFGPDGAAVHKIFSQEGTDLAAWDALVDAFAADLPAPAIQPAAAPKVPLPDSAIDVAGLLAGWDGLRDTHHFHGLLRRFDVARTQAFRLGGPERARSVAASSLRAVLQRAAAARMPIMVFVGNAGCIQIHSGPVAELRATGPWFNVLDPRFSLHLREGAIDSAWVVRKPTDDGVVTSLELFDALGAAIATLFGRRKPGQAEDPAWRALCASLADA
jgi:putative hemin transport protein